MSWRAVRKLAEGWSADSSQVRSVPETGCWRGIRGAALFRGALWKIVLFCPAPGGTFALEHGPRKLSSAWVDMEVLSNAKVRRRHSAGGPWRRELFARRAE